MVESIVGDWGDCYKATNETCKTNMAGYTTTSIRSNRSRRINELSGDIGWIWGRGQEEEESKMLQDCKFLKFS